MCFWKEHALGKSLQIMKRNYMKKIGNSKRVVSNSCEEELLFVTKYDVRLTVERNDMPK